MTQDEYEVGTLEDANKFAIIRMALEADIDAEAEGLTQALERFFNLAFAAGAAHEREACAKVCEKAMIQMNYSEAPYKQCAAAIRARG